MARYATIAGTGHYVPERVLTNAELEQQLGLAIGDWLVANVGIEQRHVMAAEQTTSDLAVAAARPALQRAGIVATDLDLIIVATDTPDYLSPATASVVQAKLGAERAGTYDLNCACASWVAGIDAACKYIAADPDYNNILVVGAYAMTRFIDWTDKYTCTLFADGAGAAVLRASSEPGFLAARLQACGDYHDALGIYTGGTFRPATAASIDQFGPPHVQFVRKFPASFNTERWPALVRDVVAKAGLALDDVALFLFTQLNRRTIADTLTALGQPLSKTHCIMHKWGYTGAACIPMALDDAVAAGKLKRGDQLVLCASGGGIAMAAAVFRWTL